MYSASPAFLSWGMIKQFFGALLLCALLGAASLFLASQGLFARELAVLIIAGLLLFSVLWLWLWRRSRRYLITSRGVLVESGFLMRTNQRELSFRRIQLVEVQQTIIERLLLGTGDVLIGSASSEASQDQLVFEGVRAPKRVANMIREGEDAGRQPDLAGYNPYQPEAGHSGQYAPAAQPAGNDFQAKAPWDMSDDQQSPAWDQPDQDRERPPLPPR